jgi:hypothetical protein
LARRQDGCANPWLILRTDELAGLHIVVHATRSKIDHSGGILDERALEEAAIDARREQHDLPELERAG